ncbi:hypothetical protein H5410_055453 [Solanum commersonii]|uniref:Pentatricopeptide repeat-containing protein n=1 Tax=Solanum commersonii TaxID=4109 RepID=A0A9J5WJ55_SOLCO|nr:hypothetical protein H5410_055453 [Solanum commersonii]
MNWRPQMIATYNSLIDLYRKAGRVKDAADVLNEMLKSDFGRCNIQHYDLYLWKSWLLEKDGSFTEQDGCLVDGADEYLQLLNVQSKRLATFHRTWHFEFVFLLSKLGKSRTYVKYVIEQEDLRAEINRLKDELAQENKMECEELPVNGT